MPLPVADGVAGVALAWPYQKSWVLGRSPALSLEHSRQRLGYSHCHRTNQAKYCVGARAQKLPEPRINTLSCAEVFRQELHNFKGDTVVNGRCVSQGARTVQYDFGRGSVYGRIPPDPGSDPAQ